MRFIIDSQLPPALAGWLSEAGHDARHVTSIGLGAADDPTVWRYALENDVALITKNEGFIGRGRQSQRSPIIVLLRVGNTSCRSMRLWLAPQLPQIIDWSSQGHRLIEVR